MVPLSTSINMGALIKNLTGLQVSRLTVLEFAFTDRTRHAWWTCLCSCGTVKDVCGVALTSKNPTRSCGCLQREIAADRLRKTRSRKTQQTDWPVQQIIEAAVNWPDHFAA